MKLFKITEPTASPVPIVISVPHSGTGFPKDIRKHYNKRLRNIADDTDWFVHKLYNFASELGITVIKANLSRWVIDLNRDPESVPLYNDGRLITSCTPATDFYGNKLYKSEELEPDQAEKNRRLEQYYWPYYKAVQHLLDQRKEAFGKVLLWDAHSIRHRVSTIQKDPFPDMILGNNEGKTAHPSIISTALESLSSGPYKLSHNTPFKGGHITRYFGNPDKNIHALQLEMNKILYMDDNELTYNKSRAASVRDLLKPCMISMINAVEAL